MLPSRIARATTPALLAMFFACAHAFAAKPHSASTSALTVSASSLDFGSVAVGQVASPQVITLKNSGATRRTLGAITLSDTTNYSMSSTCTKTLAAAGSCTISLTFKPQTAAALSASLSISGLPASSRSIALSGTGSSTSTTTASSRVLHVEPDEGFQWVYALVTAAQTSIDMTMYELVDTTFSADLVAACKRGVKVRVILDGKLEKTSNTTAYTLLNGTTNCAAVFSNTAFQATHEKSMIIDGATAVIMTFNLTSRYYTETRDFGIVESDAADIAAIEATFVADYAAGTPSNGKPGTSDFSYQPGAGDDLIWSPTTAEADLLAIINGAQKTLLVENEELGAANIVSALEAACKRGVTVNLAMTDTSTSYHANYTALEAAGCGVHIGANNSTTLYIHAKSILADFGLSTQKVYLGSINFSIASMTENRELGMYVTDAGIVQQLNTAMSSDYALFPAYQ